MHERASRQKNCDTLFQTIVIKILCKCTTYMYNDENSSFIEKDVHSRYKDRKKYSIY